jgi:predicted SprT family Zn-dependent metalloprotease
MQLWSALSAIGERGLGMRKSSTRVQNIGVRRIAQDQLPAESDLQLLFAQLNFIHFSGEVPAYRIAFNARLTSVAGRITYRPPLIELSTPLLGAHLDTLDKTLLHEMVHAWLHARRMPSGHGPHFKRKMRDVGLSSIYHSLPVPRRRSRARYALSCPRCSAELIRRCRPGVPVSCARCSPQRYDARVRMSIRRLA